MATLTADDVNDNVLQTPTAAVRHLRNNSPKSVIYSMLRSNRAPSGRDIAVCRPDAATPLGIAVALHGCTHVAITNTIACSSAAEGLSGSPEASITAFSLNRVQRFIELHVPTLDPYWTPQSPLVSHVSIRSRRLYIPNARSRFKDGLMGLE